MVGTCPECRSVVVSRCIYEQPPSMILVNIEQQKVPVDTKVTMGTVDGVIHSYNLSGVIYLGGFHFVS